jgi:hypothetical protein
MSFEEVILCKIHTNIQDILCITTIFSSYMNTDSSQVIM